MVEVTEDQQTADQVLQSFVDIAEGKAYVTELDLQNSLVPDSMIDVLVRSMPLHEEFAHEQESDAALQREGKGLDYIKYMQNSQASNSLSLYDKKLMKSKTVSWIIYINLYIYVSRDFIFFSYSYFIPFYLGPSLVKIDGPCSSHSCLLIHKWSLSFIMFARTAPPMKTMCLLLGGSSILTLNFSSRSGLPCSTLVSHSCLSSFSKREGRPGYMDEPPLSTIALYKLDRTSRSAD